jgi:Glycosyl hydrolases family 16.
VQGLAILVIIQFNRDENVIVSNGTLKLTIEQKTNTWQCDSCNPTRCPEPGWGDVPRTENYTSGYISSKLRFDNGKVETRVRMPNNKNSWGTIWFWLGTNTNEIDIAEAWGGNYGAIGENAKTTQYLVHTCLGDRFG